MPVSIQRNPTSYCFKDFGVAGNGTTDDTAAMNATLLLAHNNGGGIVTSSPGASHLISAPLVIYSNTKLLLDASNTITLAPSSNCNMIKNAGATAQRTVTDAAITTGTATLTSATANFTSADIGRTVQVTNAWVGNFILIANIIAVGSTTSCTLSVAASATVSNVACSIFTRDSNIEIAGGIWNRGNNGSSVGGSVGTNTTNFRHVDWMYVHDAQFWYGTLRSYNLCFCDVTNLRVKDITLNGPNTVPNTDGVCVDGPCQFVAIDGIYGTNGDDMVSMHTVSLDGIAGNQSDSVVSNLFPNQCQNAFKVHGDNSTTVRSLTVRGVHGTCSAGAVHLQDYITPTSDSNLGDILVEDVDCIVSVSSLINITCNNPNGTITLKNIVWRQNLSGGVAIYVPSATILKNLVVDGLQIEAGSASLGFLIQGTITNLTVSNVIAPSTSVQYNALVSLDTTSVMSTFTLRDAVLFFPTNAQNFVLANKGALKVAVFENIYVNNGGILFSQQTASIACQCLMTNITLDGAYQFAQVTACAVDFSLSNINILSTNQSALIKLTTAGANISIRGRGLINPNNKTAFVRDTTQTVRISHPEMQADIATLQNNAGDECQNTNSASGPLGRVIGNGTTWYAIGAPAMPAPFLLYDPVAATGGAGVVGAGIVWFFGVSINTTITLAQMRTWFSGTPTGSVSMGVYDATGTNGQPNNLLGQTGANAAAAGVFTKNLTANLTLAPGQYWIAFLDTVADSIPLRNVAAAGLSPYYRTNASGITVLPATAGTVVTHPQGFLFEALVLNSYA